MCGICGKLNFDSEEPVSKGLLNKMMELLYHRGPDGGGQYRSGPVGLAHRRLSIIDLSTGDQPMANEDGTVWVVYNGEIYNFKELRADLESKGHIFRSESDTEVIVHLYEECGVDSIEKLEGMFAFALWDERKHTLLLVRDRVGIKPLYYTNTGKALVFASEIKAILADDSVVGSISPHAIDHFLTYNYLPGNETLFQEIWKLDPGHYMLVRNGKISIHQYWDLEFERSPRSMKFDETVESLRELLRKTVKAHMISDVPVGVLLSGGVDSTGVLRYAVEETDEPIRTFTVGFRGERFQDERPYARLAANRYGTIHQDITISAEEFRDFLSNYVWYMEEPVCEPPAIALYYVSRLAREAGVKVLLSGEGGDEAFGGYQNYRNILFLEQLKAGLGPAKGLLKLVFRILGKIGKHNLTRYAELVDLPIEHYYLSRTATPRTGFNKLKKDLYTNEFVEVLNHQPVKLPTAVLADRIKNMSHLDKMLYLDTKTWLPDDLLIKADKMTMATSIELRVPLLDFHLLEFAASLPQNFKVYGWSLKRILKRALSESVPREILNRKKTGFPVPYEYWLKKELRNFVMDTCLGSNSRLFNYFSKREVRRIITENIKRANFSKEVFSLLVLEIWHRVFI
ncbi:MAG: asparagine synthase (glutamine-hydrolyzing) [Deltaproteobacteria bacterium]|nr:asparagine synthase (glutamine-hydrolyzing) [Deltaproteobacteria bacterium]MBW2024935.1 asparagine synthase (glutamine-hydrolyzing) [Deltaproteobacteria bacterium]MBW2124964.1 asparagine synthase (glutamine-hydrolyzing) [Deltaproteobacteria bacterium]